MSTVTCVFVRVCRGGGHAAVVAAVGAAAVGAAAVGAYYIRVSSKTT